MINPNLPEDEKLNITTKSLVKSWTKKYLAMTDNDWEDVNIEEITTTNNSDIVFIKCQTKSDAAKLTVRATKTTPRHRP